MKKRLIVIACFACLIASSCASTMTTQQKVDSGFAVASQVYGLASVYYETNKDQISTEDRAKFAQYLAGFRRRSKPARTFRAMPCAGISS